MKDYIFYFSDNTYITFELSTTQFNAVKDAIAGKRDCVVFDEFVIVLKDLRYVTKRKEEVAPEGEVPEYMDMEIQEYLRRLKRGEEETGY